jgi:hypothetical protein
MRTISLAQWKKEGNELFGPDIKNWKFKCPNCGHVQTLQNFIDAGIKEPENKFYFSCIGRWTDGKGEIGNKKSPCNYTLGGLFVFCKTKIIAEDGKEVPIFEFAGAI